MIEKDAVVSNLSDNAKSYLKKHGKKKFGVV